MTSPIPSQRNPVRGRLPDGSGTGRAILGALWDLLKAENHSLRASSSKSSTGPSPCLASPPPGPGLWAHTRRAVGGGVLFLMVPLAFAGSDQQPLPVDPMALPLLPAPTVPEAIRATAPLRVYFHPSGSESVAFSPDGEMLAAGDRQGKVWIWSLGSEEGVTTVEAHRKGVRALAFSPDGQVLASGGGDGWVKVWDVATRKPQAWLDLHHRGAVTALVFSRNGDVLLSGSEDDSIWVRDAVTGRKLISYFGHSADVSGVVLAPEGMCVISSAEDRSIQAWSMKTGEQMDFSTQGAKVTASALSPDGKVLATAAANGAISVRRTNGCTVHSVAHRLLRHTGRITALQFSPDGQWLFSGGDDRLVIRWDLERARAAEIYTGHQDAISSLALSRDGLLLASASLDRTVRLWRTAEGAGVSGRPAQGGARTVSVGVSTEAATTHPATETP